MRYTIPDDDVPAFVTYLALGVLEAIRAGTVSAEVGIWTLGRPIWWEPLEDAGLVPPDILEVLTTSDALQEIAPDRYEAVIKAHIARLHAALRTLPNATWLGEWNVVEE